MEKEFIRKEIASKIGSGESTEVFLEVEIKTGQAELVISKTITERYSVKQYKNVMQLHEDLNRGGGRKLYSLQELTR